MSQPGLNMMQALIKIFCLVATHVILHFHDQSSWIDRAVSNENIFKTRYNRVPLGAVDKRIMLQTIKYANP